MTSNRPNYLDILVQLVFEPAKKNFEYFQRRLRAFSVIAIIGFPLFYVIWGTLIPQPYENLPLRLLGATLFIPLFFNSHWPQGLKRYQPYYWYLAILISTPFFFTFMLLKNNGSDVWIGSALVAVLVMILLLDWVNILIQFCLGVGLGIAAFMLTSDASHISFNYPAYIVIAIFALVVGSVASYDSERIRIEQERAMAATAGSIAHELRTPLISIRAGASGVKRYLPTLIDAYYLAREAQLGVKPIREVHLDALQGVLSRIESEVQHSNTVIDILLTNATLSGDQAHENRRCSIVRVVNSSLERYPFSDNERRLIQWQPSTDFDFLGSELLMVHVLFNLIKNALRHIEKSQKGQIQIHLDCTQHGNRLIFRDTGGGMPPDVLPHIFTRFYTSEQGSNSVLGSGIGLAFCRDVMRGFGGEIECKSVYGDFSEFTLYFPKL